MKREKTIEIYTQLLDKNGLLNQDKSKNNYKLLYRQHLDRGMTVKFYIYGSSILGPLNQNEAGYKHKVLYRQHLDIRVVISMTPRSTFLDIQI